MRCGDCKHWNRVRYMGIVGDCALMGPYSSRHKRWKCCIALRRIWRAICGLVAKQEEVEER